MTLTAALLLLFQVETATTEHYEVVSTVLNKPYVKAVADSLEAAYPALIATLGKKPVEKSRYRIHLYATVKEYEDIESTLTGGRFASNLAFSHIGTCESHLLAQPREAMVPIPDRFRALVRHEAYHLVTFRHGVREGRSAPWMEEGVADLAAELADRTGGVEPIAGSIEFANAVHRVRAFGKRGKLIPLGSLIEEGAADQAPEQFSLW